MSGENSLIVDSRAARREFTQCQKCFRDKEHYKIKLSVCTGCHIATYCGAACQKAHWPAHKLTCMQRREAQKQCTDLDATVPRPDAQTNPLPSELVAELRAFTQKFSPVLFQAAINALRLSQNPSYYRDLVMFVMLQRLPDVDPQSRPWSRFHVEFASPLPVEYMMERMGGDEHQLRQRMREQEKQHIEAGHLGTITTVICTKCASTSPPRLIHNVAFYGFGTHSFSAVEIEADWQRTFMEYVERMCGRSSVIDDSDPVLLRRLPVL